MLETARNYVKKGVSVIPVGRPDDAGQKKLPWLESWKEYQTRLPTDAELVEWFDKHPGWGIGIVTGKISNLAVVDVDIRHGGITDGLPPTLIAKTQSGGWHFYYRYLDGLKNSVGIRKGVDIRADGGYVVAPPTQGSAGKYEWAIIEEPQPFPVEALKAGINKTPKAWSAIARGVSEGARNQSAAQFIGKLLPSFKADEWDSAVWLTALNWNKSNTPPLPESELRVTFNSIVGRERRKRIGEDDAPVTLIEEAVKKFSADLSAKIGTGFSVIDSVANGGLTEGDLVLVVGPTGHGKTTFAQSLTYNLLQNQAHSVWFSFEVVLPELYEKFKSMGLPHDMQIYTPERYINRKVEWIKKKILEARDRYRCKTVFIDHLGFLLDEYDPSKRVNLNLATIFGMICRDLKTIAKQEGIIVVLMWHIRRLQRGQMEMNDEDVKDSSAVLQECDLAFGITREPGNNEKKWSQEAIEDVLGPNTFVKMLKNRRTGTLKRFKCQLFSGRLIEVDEARDRILADKSFDIL